MSGKSRLDRPPEGLQVDDVLEELDHLESAVSDEHEQAHVQRVRWMLEHVPGNGHISKYTTRDMGEAFIGGLVFSLPFLVEDGVFEIAAWFLRRSIGGVPVLLVLNVGLVVGLTTGLLYAVDIREVRIHRPLFGLIPRRLVGILVISFLCAAGAMLFWGRLHAGEPSLLEAVSRVSVVWTAAALGAVLGDILPGESKGEDVSELIDDVG